MAITSASGAPETGRRLVYRHAVLTRITHWITAISIFVLIVSGLQIFNAHPALYWGEQSHFDSPLLSMGPVRGEDGVWRGETQILGARFDTTGVFGISEDGGRTVSRGFPAWATLPSYQDLATGRRWHFFFAWLLVASAVVYLAAGLATRHVWRDLVPSLAQLRGIGRSIRDHILLRFEHGRDYNVLQKLAYLGVMFVVLPLVVLTGMTMSPGLNAAFPWLVELFGGRQSARTIHFVCAFLFVLFIVVHLVMVLITGVFNNLRSMITGRYAIKGGAE
jgi:thiosulfate reductase cytochrome b subunit